MVQQQEVMLSVVGQHQQNLQGLKMQYEARVQSVQDECAVVIQLLKDEHEQESRDLQYEVARLTQLVATLSMTVDRSDRAGELELPTTKEMVTLHSVNHIHDEIKEKV
jgi:hypothetical protein